MIMQIKTRCQRQRLMGFKVHENLVLTSCSNGEKFIVLSVRNIPKRRDRANWSRDTVQPMRRRAFVPQNIDQMVKVFLKWRREADKALLLFSPSFPFNRS